MTHILYYSESATPVICEREDWRTCPEHKHLTDKKPEIAKDEFMVPDSVLKDDPNDGIVSVNEYENINVKPKFQETISEAADDEAKMRLQIMNIAGSAIVGIGVGVVSGAMIFALPVLVLGSIAGTAASWALRKRSLQRRNITVR